MKVRQHEFMTIVGPSGCGKSTLLSLMAVIRTLAYDPAIIFMDDFVRIHKQIWSDLKSEVLKSASEAPPMNENTRLSNILQKALIFMVVGAGLWLWEYAADTKILNTFYASQPSVIAKDFYGFVVSGEILKHLSVTLQEAFFGLVFGTMAGIVCGVILGHILLDGTIPAQHKQVYGSEKYQAMCVQVRDDYIKEHPETVQAFANAVYKGMLWQVAHTDEKIAKAVAPMFPGRNIDAGLISVLRKCWSTDGQFTQDGYDAVINFCLANGVLKKAIPMADSVDQSFMQKAKAAIR